MTSHPIPFRLSLTVPASTSPSSPSSLDTFDVIQRCLPPNFVVENWSRHTDYADISTIGSRVTQQLAINTHVEITGHISPYWPNG